jgi:hypothetical protein
LARLNPTALSYSTLSGSATITHPFHPFRGQKIQILKSKCISGIETIIVKHKTRGSFAVPFDWTDLKEPEISNTPNASSPILSFAHLLDLVALVENIKPKRG